VLTFSVRHWVAWAAGVERREDWERWCRAPAPLLANGSPALEFLPPLFRRRCSALSRLMIHVAYAACGQDAVGALPMVFASRYGELALTVSLLESLARAEPLPAGGFTHSIHNTQVGLFSISAKNRHMATALSAGADTFVSSILEALAIIERTGTGPALLVIADEPVPPPLKKFEEAPSAAYALALIIERAGGDGVGLAPAAASMLPSRPAWPQAIEFLRWLLSSEPTLTLRGRSAWTAVRA
jgi:beta-ketoacyl synthase-like protein